MLDRQEKNKIFIILLYFYITTFRAESRWRSTNGRCMRDASFARKCHDLLL